MWWRLVFKEIWKRKWGFLFSSLAVAIAIAVFAVIATINKSVEDEARIISLKMQQNIVIVPGGVPPDRYHLGDFGDHWMPERTVEVVRDSQQSAVVDWVDDPEQPGVKRKRIRLLPTGEADAIRKSAPPGQVVYTHALPLLAEHFVAEIQVRRTAASGGRRMEVVLTGQRPVGGRKRHLTAPPDRGHAYVGAAVAEQLAVGPGDTLELDGRTFTVDRVEEPQMAVDDIRVYVDLALVQEMVDKPGQINRIMALGCLCEGLAIGEVGNVLQRAINEWTTEDGEQITQARVVPMSRIGTAREQMRLLVMRTAQYLTPLLGLICAALVGGYFYFNVRERQQEMGVMLAIGYRLGPIMAAILLKLLLIGVVGFAAGFYGGILLGYQIAPSLKLTRVLGAWELWHAALGGAVVLTLLAGLYPLIVAARTEAATILRNA